MATAQQPTRFSRYRFGRDEDTFAQIAEAIRSNLDAFKKLGVLSVRPGYKAVGGWITQKPSIVVTVQKKIPNIPAGSALPTSVAGFPVDVREAGTLERERAAQPANYEQLASSGRGEYVLPEFPGEVTPTGTPVNVVQPAELAAAAGAPQMAYKAPTGVSLDAVEDEMTITCHASPDAGWNQLKKFFTGVENELTVGMYDFTSAHILNELETIIKGKDMTLTLDHPTKNPTADQTDEETVKDLSEARLSKFESAWALVRSSPKAPEWIYPTAYHIKVAVRDAKSFWLSSGNWNNSNQPDIDPLTDKSAETLATAKKSDRDWHVIVEHEDLAKTYRAFLHNDFAVANQIETSPALATAAFASQLDMAAEGPTIESDLAMARRTPAQFFAPKTITGKIKIQPILTPDNYHESVLPLIQSATKSFYMQTQYIHPSDKDQDQDLVDLINAVAQLQNDGVDVRLILSQWQAQGKGGWMEKLQAAGIDLASVRIQTGVHNKGIVVDSKVVMLGSQNWSGDGVIRNRDASLIIYNTDAAQYYEQIFLHDWTKLARQQAPI